MWSELLLLSIISIVHSLPASLHQFRLKEAKILKVKFHSIISFCRVSARCKRTSSRLSARARPVWWCSHTQVSKWTRSNKYFLTQKYFSPDLKLYTTNIGDSGFLVVRRGEVVHRWVELSEQKIYSVNVKIVKLLIFLKNRMRTFRTLNWRQGLHGRRV